jgi:hypothetical protein
MIFQVWPPSVVRHKLLLAIHPISFVTKSGTGA